MAESSERTQGSEIDIQQRHPFLMFYLSTAVFSGTIILAGRLHSFWRDVDRVLALLTGVFAAWSFYKLFGLTDERQRQTNEEALRFGFLTTLVLALFGGSLLGFGAPLISCGGILAVMLIAWSVGLILHSWRYR